jgi:hypothetical protein
MAEDPIVGKRLRIEYADQNESFAPFLPRAGTVIRRCVTTTGDSNWIHVLLDTGFDFQAKSGDSLRFRLIDCNEFLIHPRHIGEQIGEKQPAAVFVLLVSSEQRLVDPLDLKEFHHVAWGISYTLE